MKGFHYVLQKEMDLPPKEWRTMLQDIVQKGGRRRNEAGETFAHGADSLLVFEVYGTIQLPKEDLS